VEKILKFGVCLAVSFAVTNVFAESKTGLFIATAHVASSALYCKGDDVNQTCSTSPGDIIPLEPTVSSIAVETVNDEIPQGASKIGAVMGGDTPDKLWVHVDGSGTVIDGLAMQSSELTGQNTGKPIPIDAYYVPCGTSPSPDGVVSSQPAGTMLSGNVVSIENDSNTCNTGGNVYLVFDVENTKLANGFLNPDTYSGDVNLVMQGISQ